jgi:hypothetical protein
VFIALRDYEKEEEALLKKGNIKVIPVAELRRKGVENVVRQKSIQQMYDTPKNKRMNLIRIKMDREELEKIRDRKEWFKECIETDSMLLLDIYTEIKNKRKMWS